MLIISYQGIYDGQNFEDANTPGQIAKAFNNGFSVMADVWRFDNKLYLGIENDWVEVTDRYLQGVKWWLNCQNQDAYDYLLAQPRKLYPNVDFYSGIIYEAIGIPSQMFTVLFAVARTVGWISQWKEMIEDENQKIARPRQLYTGYNLREFKKLSERD